MKQLLTLLCTALLSSSLFLSSVETNSNSGHINWLTNYDEAVTQAKATSKPIILFFTGSDWCGWCTKLEQESLNTSEFIKNAGNKFIFVKLDFPLNSTLPSHIAAQNKELQKKFNIRGFPTLVILDSQQQKQVGTTGYRAGGGKLFAEHLSKIVGEYSQYNQKLQALEKQKYSSLDLKKMYDLASLNKHKKDLMRIIKAGESSDDRHYFMLEHYRHLADNGLVNDDEAISLKKQLLMQDPNNEKKTHYQIALINFEARNEIEKEKKTSEQTVADLTQYIQQFGSQDKENLWRLQLIISQVYFDKNNLNEALKFAQNAYLSAPTSAKTEIAIAIKSIQAQVTTTETAMNH